MARAPLAPSPVRRALTLVAVLVVLAVVVAAGTLVRAQQPDPRTVVTAAAGQTDAICTVGTVSAQSSASPSPSAVPTAGVPSASTPGTVPTPLPTDAQTAVPTITPGAPATTPATPGTTLPSTTPPGVAPAAPGGTVSPSPSATAVPTLTPGAQTPATQTPGTPTPGTTLPGATPSTDPTPSSAPSLVPLPSATAQAVSGSVVAVASGPTDTGSDDPTGRLTLGLLGQPETTTTVDRQGRGATLSPAAAPVLLQAEGTIATTAVGAVLSRSDDGPEAGLEAAPCLASSTSAWLVGIASGAADRTELVLSNPDDAEATVDLTFYGRNGRVAVPGSAGSDVPAHGSRSISLSGLVDAEGPLTVAVQATSGRVAAVARRIRTSGDTPAGADWVVPAATPARQVVVPAVPGDDGDRALVVTNPGELRTTVSVSVLGLQGPFAPVGAETLELGPQSSGTVALADGLAGTGSGVALTSDQPVTAAVVSTSARSGAQADIAVQPAAPALVRTGVSAIATTRDTDAELVLSNAATTDVSVHFSVRSFAGVELRGGDVLLAAGGSATRRLASPAPSYVVVDVPEGSSVTGGVDLSQSSGDVAGLASVPLVSPDTSGPPPVVEQDPGAGR